MHKALEDDSNEVTAAVVDDARVKVVKDSRSLTMIFATIIDTVYAASGAGCGFTSHLSTFYPTSYLSSSVSGVNAAAACQR